MILVDNRYTPWPLCAPTRNAPSSSVYFLGQFDYKESGREITDLWADSHWREGVTAYVHTNCGAWEISHNFSLGVRDNQHASLTYANALVLNCWWAIVTGAPLHKR